MIPKKIHRLWLGPKEMPQKYVDYGINWQELNPDWEVIEWNQDNLPEIINQGIWDMIGNWPKSSIPMERERAVAVQRADMLSYELMLRFGGVYTNCDIQPLRPLSQLLDETGDRAFAPYEDVYDGRWYIVNALLGGPADHPFWKACVDELPIRYLNMLDAPMEQTTGPHHITDIYERHFARNDLFMPLPKDYYNPVHFREIEVGQDASDRVEWAREQGAHGIHHWGHREDQINYV